MPRKTVPKTKHSYTAIERDEWVDEGTGEVRRKLDLYEPSGAEDGPFRGRPPKGSTRTRVKDGRSRKVTQGWAYTDVESMGMLDLSRQEYRVFAFLVSKVDIPAGTIRVTNQFMARSIGMTPNNVSKALKSLRERYVILPEAYGVWRINRNIMFVGKYPDWPKGAAEDPEPIWALEEEVERVPHLAVVE